MCRRSICYEVEKEISGVEEKGKVGIEGVLLQKKHSNNRLNVFFSQME
jgi:hypothetical protein